MQLKGINTYSQLSINNDTPTKALFVSDTLTALPSIDNLKTTDTFPGIYGTALSVGCNTGHTLSGDSSITCEKDAVFTYTNQPICNIGT